MIECIKRKLLLRSFYVGRWRQMTPTTRWVVSLSLVLLVGIVMVAYAADIPIACIIGMEYIC